MKTRVIEHNLNGYTWYTVQYKQFLIWHTWRSLDGYDVEYNDKEDAITRANKLKAKVIKKIIYENN